MMPAFVGDAHLAVRHPEDVDGRGLAGRLGGDELLDRLLAVDLVVVDLDAVLGLEAADDLGEEVLLRFAEVVEDDLAFGFGGGPRTS